MLNKNGVKVGIAKFFLSVFIILHVTTMVVVSNPGSILSRSLPHFMISYASTLGLNTTWRFFSPNPAGERYIEYEVHFNNEEFNDDDIGGDHSDSEGDGGGSDSDGGNGSNSDGHRSNDDDMEIHEYHWPPRSSEGMLRVNINRSFSHSVAATLSEETIKYIFIPWVCRKHPKAHSISVLVQTKTLPSIEAAQIKNKKIEHLAKVHDFPLKEYTCPER